MRQWMSRVSFQSPSISLYFVTPIQCYGDFLILQHVLFAQRKSLFLVEGNIQKRYFKLSISMTATLLQPAVASTSRHAHISTEQLYLGIHCKSAPDGVLSLAGECWSFIAFAIYGVFFIHIKARLNIY